MSKLVKCDRCGALIEKTEAYYDLRIRRGANSVLKDIIKRLDNLERLVRYGGGIGGYDK